MAEATATADSLGALAAHLAKGNTDAEKGRQWSAKMMQKGDKIPTMWARRSAMALESIHNMLRAWFADMQKNNSKMQEAMLEGSRKKNDEPGKSDTKWAVKGGILMAGTLLALAAWQGPVQSALNILYKSKWAATIGSFGKYLKVRALKLFAPITRIMTAIGEIWSKRGTMQFLKGSTLKALGRFVRPFEKLFLWIARAEKWLKGLTVPKGVTTGFGKIGAFFKSIGNFFKPVTKFLKPIMTFFSGVGKTIGSGFKAISGFFSSIGKFIKPIFGIITKALPFLKGIPFIGWVITAIMGVFDFIKGFIAGWTGSDEDAGFISKLLSGVWGGIKGFLIGLIAKPLDLIKDGIAWIFEKMGMTDVAAAMGGFSFEKLFDDVFKWIKTTVDKIGTWFGELFADPVGKVMSLMPLWILDFGTWISDKLWKPLTAWFDKMMTDPFGTLKAMWDSVVAPYIAFGQMIYDKAIKPVIDWFGTMFKTKGKTIAEIIKGKWDKITNFASSVYDQYIKPIVDWVDSLFGGGDKKKKPAGAADGMFSGLKDFKLPSIDDMVGTVMAKVAQAVQWIGDKALAVLPSFASINEKVASVFFGAADYVKGLGATGGGGGSDATGVASGSVGGGGGAAATAGGSDAVPVVRVVGGGGGTVVNMTDASQKTNVSSKSGTVKGAVKAASIAGSRGRG